MVDPFVLLTDEGGASPTYKATLIAGRNRPTIATPDRREPGSGKREAPGPARG